MRGEATLAALRTMKPTPFGKYTLLERISYGGMAEVFKAKSFGAAGFERILAIKVLLPAMASDQDFITMLIDEAKIAGQLSHANIAQTFDLGQHDGRYYIVQEYVHGRDLRSLLAHLDKTGGRLGVAQACHIMLKICEGLDYAHNRLDARGQPLNVVHRDVSPQNVIVSFEGEVKLIDFGIAKAEGRATRTMAGLVKGKFAYMSPEQLRGLPVDRRSDVFACGVLAHELLSGRPLFRRESDFETLKRARTAEIEPPSDHNPEVPAELDRIVLKALSRHVDDRYQTALAFRDDLLAFVRQHKCDYARHQLSAWMRETLGELTGGHPRVEPSLPAFEAEGQPTVDMGPSRREAPARLDSPRPDAGYRRAADAATRLTPPPVEQFTSSVITEPSLHGSVVTQPKAATMGATTVPGSFSSRRSQPVSASFEDDTTYDSDPGTDPDPTVFDPDPPEYARPAERVAVGRKPRVTTPPRIQPRAGEPPVALPPLPRAASPSFGGWQPGGMPDEAPVRSDLAAVALEVNAPSESVAVGRSRSTLILVAVGIALLLAAAAITLAVAFSGSEDPGTLAAPP